MIGSMVGSFRVVRKLGEGGMGEVYEAVQDEIAKRAAIKVLHPELSQNPEVSGRFLNEAKAVNLIQHPGIVSVYEYGRLPNGAAFIIMEFLEGESLTRRIERGRLMTRDILRLTRQIASTLSAAHAKEIVHRDLKPDNVMLVPDPDVAGGERAKILDFGIAKVKDARAEAGSDRTRAGLVLGTPAYMAPEQCRGARDVTDRADVYALGVIVYELVSGRRPFASDEPGTLMAMHIYEPTPPLVASPALHKSVPPALVRLVERMLAKEPTARPSMAEVVAEMEALGATPSGVALPPVAERPRRRSRAPLWLAGAAALLIGGGVAGLVLTRTGARAGAGPATTTMRGGTAPAERPAGGGAGAEANGGADDAACAAGRWCAVASPAPGTTLLALAGAGDTLFAVGYHGTILRRDAGRWAPMASPVGTILRGVWAASAREAWAVGDRGTLLRWDGAAWRTVESGTTAALQDVFGLSPDDVWAVGQGGTVLRVRHGAPTPVDTHSTRTLDGVWGADARDLWVVGQGGTVLRFDGTRFITLVSGTTRALTAVAGSAADDVFAVGQAGTVLHWDGFAWSPVPGSLTRPLDAVYAAARGRAWVAGDYGTVARVTPSGAVPLDSGATAELTAIASDTAGLWAVGRSGTLLRYRR